MDVMIEPVLLLEEVAGIAKQCRLAHLLLAVVEGADVATGAECLLAGPCSNTQTMAGSCSQRVSAACNNWIISRLRALRRRGCPGQHADVAAIRRGVGLDAHRLTHGEPPQTGYLPLRHGGPPSLPHSSFSLTLSGLDWS
jgi:hypothetical protein